MQCVGYCGALGELAEYELCIPRQDSEQEPAVALVTQGTLFLQPPEPKQKHTIAVVVIRTLRQCLSATGLPLADCNLYAGGNTVAASSGSSSSRSKSTPALAEIATASSQAERPPEGAELTATTSRANSMDVSEVSGHDQEAAAPTAAAAATAGVASAGTSSTADSTVNGVGSSSDTVDSSAAAQATAAAAAEVPQESTVDAVDASAAPDVTINGNGSSSDSRESRPSSSSSRTGSSSSSSRGGDQLPSLSPADLVREMRNMKTENLELVKMLAAQLQEVRGQPGYLLLVPMILAWVSA